MPVCGIFFHTLGKTWGGRQGKLSYRLLLLASFNLHQPPKTLLLASLDIHQPLHTPPTGQPQHPPAFKAPSCCPSLVVLSLLRHTHQPLYCPLAEPALLTLTNPFTPLLLPDLAFLAQQWHDNRRHIRDIAKIPRT